MGSRTILCGSVRLSKAAFEKAQDTALLEMAFMASDDPAEIGVTMKPVTARELFSPGDEAYRLWAVNRYDEANEHRTVFVA